MSTIWSVLATGLAWLPSFNVISHGITPSSQSEIHSITGNDFLETASSLESGSAGHQLPERGQGPENNSFDDATDPEDVQPQTGHDPSAGAQDSGDARQQAAGGDPGFIQGLFASLEVRITAALFLIVIPGLVLGVVTGQLPEGLGLCAVMAAVVTLFKHFFFTRNL